MDQERRGGAVRVAGVRNYDHPNLFNFRDLGGYLAADGRTVRWRRLFRSDSLSRIDPAEAASFTALGVRTVIDLRRPREIERDGRIPEFDGLAYRYLDLAEAGNAPVHCVAGKDRTGVVASHLLDDPR
jgi:protein tyrosine/serine phosphatase